MVAARAAGARLVCFPEGAISGGLSLGSWSETGTAGWSIDWAAAQHQLELTAKVAADLGIWVVVGSSHRLTPPNRPHNSLYVISDGGQLVSRYDKRRCSHTEITDWYSPGFAPLTSDVDGFRFGSALCIEVNFPELFIEYRELGVDCVLLSSFSEDPVFGVLARGHAAAHTYWVSVSVPAQCSAAMPAGVTGPHGFWLDRCPADGTTALACVDLDRTDPSLDTALNKARAWRKSARAGLIYEARRVADARSTDRTRFCRTARHRRSVERRQAGHPGRAGRRLRRSAHRLPPVRPAGRGPGPDPVGPGDAPPGTLAGRVLPGPSEGWSNAPARRRVRLRRPLHLGEEQAVTVTNTRLYGRATARARDRLHPRLTQRAAWLDHDGPLPVIEGTVIRMGRAPAVRQDQQAGMAVVVTHRRHRSRHRSGRGSGRPTSLRARDDARAAASGPPGTTPHRPHTAPRPSARTTRRAERSDTRRTRPGNLTLPRTLPSGQHQATDSPSRPSSWSRAPWSEHRIRRRRPARPAIPLAGESVRDVILTRTPSGTPCWKLK